MLACLLLFASALDTADGYHGALSRAGDVDGDGVPDVVVAYRALLRSGEGSGRDEHGAVRVLSGLDGAVLHVFDPTREGFGCSLAGGVDLDGDGHADVVVGATDPRPRKGPGAGCVEVYSGRTGRPLTRLESGLEGDAFGFAVAAGDDVDGDGLPDVVVGAPARSADCAGTVYVFSGVGHLVHVLDGELAPSPTPTRGWRGFGAGVGVLGDLDGDGRAEFVVSDPGWLGEHGRGRATVHSGRDASVVRTLEYDRRWGGVFGWVLVAVGDVDADGLPDLGATAPDDTVRVYSGRSFEKLCEWTYSGGYMVFEGTTMDRVGDLDGDGHDDFVYGANETYLDRDPGFARVVSGRTFETLRAFRPQDGVDVCGLGDVDGDGLGDVAVALRDARVVRCLSGKDFGELWSVDLDALARRGATMQSSGETDD